MRQRTQYRLHQLGATLLEVIIALALLGSVVVGAATLLDQHQERLKIAATAQQMQIFAKGVKDFVKDNYPYLVSGGNGLTPASANQPTVLTVHTLQSTPDPNTGQLSATRYLPAGFQNQNPYQQTLCALVLQPKPNELYTLVITENLDPQAKAINDVDLGLLVAAMGAHGGGIYRVAPTKARGALGRWEFDLNTDPVGQFFKNAQSNCLAEAKPLKLLDPNQPGGRPLMALWFAEDTSSAFLYRDEVPGHPELNTMQTDLRFKPDEDPSHNKFDGATVQIQIVRKIGEECDLSPTAGSPVTNIATQKKEVPVGTLARTAKGDVLTCQIVGGQRIWTGPISIGRWQFLIKKPGSNETKSFVGTGYFSDATSFSGTLNCDPETSTDFNCGNSGNVNCINSNKTTQANCAWGYAGGNDETEWICTSSLPLIGCIAWTPIPITRKYQVDVVNQTVIKTINSPRQLWPQ